MAGEAAKLASSFAAAAAVSSRFSAAAKSSPRWGCRARRNRQPAAARIPPTAAAECSSRRTPQSPPHEIAGLERGGQMGVTCLLLWNLDGVRPRLDQRFAV